MGGDQRENRGKGFFCEKRRKFAILRRAKKGSFRRKRRENRSKALSPISCQMPPEGKLLPEKPATRDMARLSVSSKIEVLNNPPQNLAYLYCSYDSCRGGGSKNKPEKSLFPRKKLKTGSLNLHAHTLYCHFILSRTCMKRLKTCPEVNLTSGIKVTPQSNLRFI